MVDPRAFLTPARLGEQYYPSFAFPLHVQEFQRVFLDTLASPTDNRVVVESPIRHGKSVFWSLLVPSWYCLARPHHRVLLSGHTSEFLREFSTAIRTIMRDAAPRFGLRLDPEWDRQDSFRFLDATGRRLGGLDAISAEGPISGKGFHLAIFDDLVKDQQAANSPTRRATLLQWFMADALTRMEPDGKAAVIMSRRHPDDLSGTLLSLGDLLEPSKRWKRVTFKAIQDDGTALWPERFNLTALEDARKEYELLGKQFLFDSLFQQEPAADPSACAWPAEYLPESMFYRNLPPDLPIQLEVLALDPSAGAKDHMGDYACMARIILDQQGTFWVDDVWMERATVTRIEDVAVEWLKQYPNIRGFLIESNGFQGTVADNILGKATKAKLLFVPIFKHVSTEAKDIRIKMDLSPVLAQKRLRIRDTPITRLGFGQMKSFPSAKNDDFPDCIALGVRMVVDALRGKTPQPVTYR